MTQHFVKIRVLFGAESNFIIWQKTKSVQARKQAARAQVVQRGFRSGKFASDSHTQILSSSSSFATFNVECAQNTTLKEPVSGWLEILEQMRVDHTSHFASLRFRMFSVCWQNDLSMCQQREEAFTWPLAVMVSPEHIYFVRT